MTTNRLPRILSLLPLWLVALSASAAAESPLRWERHAFPLPQAIWGVDSIDVNADDEADLIAVGDSKVWALLAPEWQQIELADTPGGRTIHAVALDCDADGDLDLALGRSASDWIQYREALAAGTRAAEPAGEDWTVAWIENVAEARRPWPLHILDRELHGVHGLWTGDVDGDGTVDLLADSFAGPHLESSLAWFRAPASPDDDVPMTRRLITDGQATGRPHYMDFADVNADGRGDVLLGASTEGSFTWWEQPANLDRPWTRHVIAWEPGATHPRAVDLNRDGRLDVLGSAGHGQGVYWYEAPGWDRHIVDETIRDVHAFDAADLDGDGDIDCAGCSFSQQIVRWWENVGDGTFRPHDIDVDNAQEAYDLKIIDHDGDGRLDILLAGRRTENAVWYRNVALDTAANSDSGQLEGTIAFSSLAPRHFDLYQQTVGGEASRLTEHAALDFNAAFSPDGQRIAFVSERDGNMELYVANADGSHVRRLTYGIALDDHPAWSPDGKQIAFVSTREPAPAGRAWNAIYIMDATGENVRRLTPDDAADYSPAWSPRGDLVAFASGSGQTGRSDLYVMKPDGSERRLVVKNAGWPTFIEDGSALAFHSRRDGRWNVWRINLDGSDEMRLAENASMPRATFDGSKLALVRHSDHQQIAILDVESGALEHVTADDADHWNPAISPDGRTVISHRATAGQPTPNVERWGGPAGTALSLLQLDGAFPAFSPDHRRLAFAGQGFSQIDVMNLDGSDRSTIFQGDRRSLFGVSWSAQPERIAFSHGVVFGDAGASVNIKTVTPDGEDLVDLTADVGNNGFPSYSPDGTQIVFRSGRGGAKNLYIMDRNGSNARRLTEGNWTDTMCDWSPTGEWITFASNREDNFEVWMIRPDGSGLKMVIGGGGRHNHPHFSPDGNWIVFTSQRAGFSAEEVSLPRQPQPYGDLFVVRPDGTGLLRLTHNGSEEGTPAWSSAVGTVHEDGSVEDAGR